MGAIDDYKEMMSRRGDTRREALLNREKRYIRDKIRHNQSYFEAIVDGEPRIVSIANSDNYNEKVVFSMPDEDLRLGAYVYWMEQWWLITEKDYNSRVYAKCKMLQCNHLLKWVNDEDKICEIWAVIADGTKLIKRLPRRVICVLKYPLNCWNTLRAKVTKAWR